MNKKYHLDYDDVEDELEQLSESEFKIFNRNFNKSIHSRNSAQCIEAMQWYDRYGKQRNDVKGKTNVAFRISKRKTINFGCMEDYNIDTLPKTYLRVKKGTEVYELTQIGKENAGKSLLSRVFITNVLLAWTKVVLGGKKDNRYLPRINKENKSDISTLGLWCNKRKTKITKETIFLIDGIRIQKAIQDLIFIIRNHSNDTGTIKKALESGKISQQLYDTIEFKRRHSKKTRAKILYGMRMRSYRHEKHLETGDYKWKYPLYDINLLKYYIKELKSGRFFIDILTPVIKDTQNFPTKNTDLHILKPETTNDGDYKVNDNLGDYDLNQYVYERN